MEYCIVHYGEIALKGKNRNLFENRLVSNIKNKLKVNVKKYYGYFVLSSPEKVDWALLGEVPGIANFFIASGKAEKNMEALEKGILKLVENKDFESFRVSSFRHDKNFSKTSSELNRDIGSLIVERFEKKVSLENYDIEVFVKVCEDGIYFGIGRHSGIGGLPVGITGEAICLLSGGIDSPVAGFLSMKRGFKIRCIHFKPKIASSNKGEEKIKKLVKELSKFQGKVELIVVDFSKIQDQIVMKIPGKYRMLIYRRFMIRIAEKFGGVLVLGDNVAQVASQTPENLRAVYGISDSLKISPLMGFDKKDIVSLSKEIGTYDISIEKYPDCCSYLVPASPELRASLEELNQVEKDLDIGELVKAGIENSEKIIVK